MYKNSLQILLEDVQKVENYEDPTELWTFYFGPQGIPVDPCTIAPFERIMRVPGSTTPQIGDRTIPLPPTVPRGTWTELKGIYGKDECVITADGEAPPILKCGPDPNFHLIFDFEKDSRYEEAMQTCDNGLKYQRGYVVEYTA